MTVTVKATGLGTRTRLGWADSDGPTRIGFFFGGGSSQAPSTRSLLNFEDEWLCLLCGAVTHPLRSDEACRGRAAIPVRI